MYSDGNVFENNTFTENAAGAAIMFSKELVVRGNRFVNNRGYRAYGLIFQSSDRSRLEQNEISENAVGLSFNQCNQNEIVGNRVTQNYIGLRFGSNSDANRFTENIFTGNLHPVETGASDVSGSLWAVNGVGNFWDTELRAGSGSRWDRSICRIASSICSAFCAVIFLRSHFSPKVRR